MLPLLLWGGGNLFFLTLLGRGMIADQVTARLRVGCELDSLSWSPWAGVTVSGVRLLAPEGCGQEGNLLEVDQVSIDPSWTSLFAGKLRWERMEVTGGRVDLSAEAIRAVLAKFESPAIPKLKPEGQDGRLARNDPSNPQDSPNLPEPSFTGVSKEPQKERAWNERPEKKAPVGDFQGVVVFSDVTLRFFSMRAPNLAIAMTGIEGEIPLWGPAREGRFEWDELTLGDELKEVGTSLSINWRDQSIRCKADSLKVFGLDCRLNALFGMASGFPFGVQIDLPKQDVDCSPLFKRKQSPLEINGLVSRNVLQGYLATPAAFRGSHFSGFEEFVFHDLSDGGETRFERGQAVAGASAAGVVIQDLRAIGNDDAILMNGFTTFGGEAAATVRIVSSPERASSHEKRVQHGNPEWTLDFEPLLTPDRMFRDLRLEWREGQVMIDLAEGRAWVPFVSALRGVLGKRNTTLSMAP